MPPLGAAAIMAVLLAEALVVVNVGASVPLVLELQGAAARAGYSC